MAQTHVLILGAGMAGFSLARNLRKDVAAHRMRVTVVDPQPYLTYKPLLPEVAGGETQPRDTAVTLERPLRHCTLLAGVLESVDVENRTAVVRGIDGTQQPVEFDHVVFALGAVSKVMPIPGLAETAIGFSSLEEALFLHDHVLERIRFAATTTDPAERQRALTFVFVGGGYTGVEAIAELQLLARAEFGRFPQLAGESMRWMLVEVAGRIAAELPQPLSEWTSDLLRTRGIDVLLHTEMKSCENGVVELSDGGSYPSDTVVWVAGVTPNPVLHRAGVPLGAKGHVQCDACLQVITADSTPVQGAWGLGDNAQVPDLTAPSQPAYYPPNAQNAVRQATTLGENLQRAIDGRPPVEYRHRSLGMLASYGGGRGAAVVRGIRLRGIPAWMVDKLYHAVALPSLARRVRLALGWIANTLTPRDSASTDAVRHPRRRFQQAAAAQAKGD
ncbi:FAD-dependent oxidoreductase [Leifsonia sp. C5G2]|uniref:NAD(P)/FAD-dependent oxidoreductase n=1 Tax=Leifsonia sp. C5G2 TaxID=2735269 RepID=UPI001584FDD6|nr:FAD-dependent oxidoreductase [Leifsonia sp. C5G2]NUU07272.1 FAD-dependent oxidoreductase [Leifsonia sp. C5G2]